MYRTPQSQRINDSTRSLRAVFADQYFSKRVKDRGILDGARHGLIAHDAFGLSHRAGGVQDVQRIGRHQQDGVDRRRRPTAPTRRRYPNRSRPLLRARTPRDHQDAAIRLYVGAHGG